MKMKNIVILVTFFMLNAVYSGFANPIKFFVGTFTSEGAEGIYLCSFNPDDNKITLLNTFDAVDPSFLKVSPDGKYLYTVSRVPDKIEKSGGYVNAYRITENDSIIFINSQVSNGKDPCHIDIRDDGKFAAIATYGSGTVSLYELNDDGSLSSASSIIRNEGSSVNESRQSSPHAHSIKFSPYSNLVFSADLGTDRLNIFNIKNNQLIPYKQEYVVMTAGSGPRHFDFHPNGKIIYVINELNSTVTALKENNGYWNSFQSVSTLPDGYEEKSYCADIHVSPDGRFLYGSNRGHNSIAVFEIEKTSKLLKFKTTISTEGDWPRNFAITPDGNYLLVANQKSGDITVFRVDKENGIPESTGEKINLPAPVCIEFY